MEKLLKVADIQKALNISIALAYKLVHRADFPTIRIGGAIRVSQAELERWVEEQTQKTGGGERHD